MRQAGSTDPQKIKAVLESTRDLPGVYASYSWSPQDHNGFPDKNIVADIAASFRDGCYEAAPR